MALVSLTRWLMLMMSTRFMIDAINRERLTELNPAGPCTDLMFRVMKLMAILELLALSYTVLGDGKANSSQNQPQKARN